MITRLLYCSHASRIISLYDIQQILESARRFNAPYGITGMLCHSNQIFLQYIEGEESAIDQLYKRIASDERHKDLRILHRSQAEFARFTDWSMGFVSSYDSPVREMLEKETGINILQDEKLTPAQAMAIITQLKEMLYLQQRVSPEINM